MPYMNCIFAGELGMLFIGHRMFEHNATDTTRLHLSDLEVYVER